LNFDVSESYFRRCLRGVALLTLMVAMAAPVADAASSILSGNHPDVSDLGPLRAAPQSKVLNMHLDLAIRDSKALEQFLADLQDPTSSTYHQWTTPAGFAARFGPSAADVAKVAAYLKSNGFQVNATDALTRGIDFTGSVAKAERTFGLKIAVTADGSNFANLNDPALPSDIAPAVNSIEGLDNLVHAAPAAAIAKGISETPDDVVGKAGPNFGPQDIYNFYDETPLIGTLDGTGTQCIALIEDSNFLLASANAFNTQFSLPQFTSSNLSVEAVDPNATSILNANQVETLVDLNYAHTTAPGAPIKVYLGNEATASSGSGLIDALSAAVHENQCSSIVLSFGFCGVTNKFYKSVNSIFAQAAGQGQAVFVAAGDDGANGLIFKKKSNGCVLAPTGKHPSEVATSPNVTAVGGTEFSPNYVSGVDSGDVPESAWNDEGALFGGATGGGRSKIFSKPSFQAAVMPKDKKRDYPDVAFGAGGTNPGFFVSVPSQALVECCVAGTSVGSPSWAGISQLIAERTNGRLGNIDFRLYGMASSGGQPAGIRDVTTGSNGIGSVKGYSAGPGFDLTTGWGTPDIATFVNAF
jgi:subtilase family serine protease